METRSIAALVHGEYLLETGPKGSPLLVGFHGYGETARDHLTELKSIPGSEHWTRCAVQALHPFYKRSTGEVVRSWMTKENRDVTIDDNIRYVSSVVSEVKRLHGAQGPLVFAGFSQGVAMAWRAAAGCGFPCHGLIVLAGDVPAEVPARFGGRVPAVLLGRGTEDAWYSEAKMNQDLETLKRTQAKVTDCVFQAGHVWHDDYRQAAGRFLAEIAGSV